MGADTIVIMYDDLGRSGATIEGRFGFQILNQEGCRPAKRRNALNPPMVHLPWASGYFVEPYATLSVFQEDHHRRLE
jgi:hypothetical protein